MDVEEPGTPANDNVLLTMAEHTRAKHRVLTEYLKAWFPILATFDNRIIFLDGFAGPGEYNDPEHSVGSPIIAIQTALNHRLFQSKLSQKEIIFIFVEKSEARADYLRQKLDQMYSLKEEGKYSKLPEKWNVDVNTGEFSKVTGPLVGGLEAKNLNLAPTMAFIDPFGYKDLDLELLGRILRFPKCELLITYMTGFMDRFCFDAMHEDSIKQALKIDDPVLQKVRSMASIDDRNLEWLRLLNEGIITAAARQANLAETPLDPVLRLSFKLKDKSNHVLYDLVYFTKGLRGIDVMKEAMYRTGKDWSYTFSDYNFTPGQSNLLDFTDEPTWQRDAAKIVYEKFKGRPLVPFVEVENFVRDPSVPYAFRKGILGVLEADNRIVVHRGTARRNSYPEDCLIDFK